MKVALRDKLKTTDFLDPNAPYLERIGALYYWGRQASQQDGQSETWEKLRSLLKPSALQDSQEVFLCLHAAILLAQHGDFDGINFILVAMDTLRRTSDRAQFELAETALRNCSEFPLAVLIAQSIDLGNVNGYGPQIQGIMRISNDGLLAYSQEKNQQRRYQELVNQLNFLNGLPRQSGREFALGTIISRPVRKDFGYRYTGFVAIGRDGQIPLVVPYNMGDILNRNDQHAKQDVWQLLRQPGHRAIVVHDINPPYEVQQLYILPLAPQTDRKTEALIAKLAKKAEGLEIGIVAELSVDKYKGYRVITASGKSSIAHYRAKHQKIGDCFLIHELNSQFLSTRYRASVADVSDIVELFKRNTHMDNAVHAKTYYHKHILVSRRGNLVYKYGDVLDQVAYFVEEVVKETETLYFPFTIPGLVWAPEERSEILSEFFARRSNALGVFLKVYDYKGSQYALVIHQQSGTALRPRADQNYPPGTLAFCEMGDDGNLYANIMPGYRIQGGCPRCFGTYYRICETCGGNSLVTCPDCEGSRQAVCVSCYGSGRENCGHCYGSGQREFTCRNCDGTGVWEGECRNCGGSGVYSGSCTVCGGAGRYADSGRICKKCGGSGDFTARCRKCSGRGTISGTCKRCDGQGQWDEKCKTCQGSGRWNCGTCHGKGRIQCMCGNGYVKCTNCQGKRVSRCECGGTERGHIVAV